MKSKTYTPILFIVLLLFSLTNCRQKQEAEAFTKGSFGYDLDFLSKHQDILVLEKGKSMVAVSPAYQGRIMTSSSNGEKGLSYGWLNYDLIGSGEILDHINAVGGEDRFWLGPEGGQFSIFFAPGATFSLKDWQTPPAIDTEPFELVSKDKTYAIFHRAIQVKNYSGSEFDLQVKRKIKLLDKSEIENLFSITKALNFVAFQSENTIINTGENGWTKETGALSMWILGMFNPSPSTTVFIPFVRGNEAELGPIVNDTYFGKVPSDRLKIDEGVIFFKCDGKFRSKIGLNPKRSLPYAGSYDEEDGVLTIIHYDKPAGVDEYVNSQWELQEEPFAGDVINSYNDGPVDGDLLGPFYELETSSPAAFLKPEDSMTHIHTTIHIEGDENEMNAIVKKLFGVELERIKNAF